MRTLTRTFIALFLFAATALAANLTGSWTGQFDGPNGEKMTLPFTFKHDGATLTGTAIGMQGETIEIAEGKVEGDNISFSITVHPNGGDGLKVLFTGKILSETEIKITLQAGDQFSQTFTITKAAK